MTTNSHILKAIGDMKSDLLREMGQMRADHSEDLREVKEQVAKQNGRIGRTESAITRLNVFAGIANALGLAGLGIAVKKLFGA